MLPKYRNWNAQRRMQEAVRLVTGEDKLSQSEAARMCGVSRSRLNEHVRAWREKQAELDRRSAEARAERNVKPILPGEERPAEEPATRPYEAVNETRRVPPLLEFNELYFSGLPCSDCGDMVHETPEFHKEMMRMMDDPAIKRLLINLPPYHAKSTVGTLRATLYDIVKDPNSRTAVITKSQNLAKKFIYQITRFLSEPDMYRYSPRNLIEDWGPFFDGDARQTTQFLYTAGRTSGDKEPTVEAFGIGSQIYGNRWNTARLDDAFDMQNSRNPEMVEFYVDWITGEVESRVGKSGKVYIIGTRVGPQDAYSFLQKLEGYHVVRYPAIIDEAEGITLWQDHFDIDAARLKRASMKPDKWQLLYQNADTLGADASFTLEMLENVRNNGRFLGQYDPGWAGVIGLDPAGGNKQSGYTALTLLAVDLKTGKRYLVDVVNQLQMKAPQLRDQLFTWADQYQGMVRELRVESNGLQSQLVQYNEEILAKMTSRGIRVVPHITHGGKGQGGKWDPEFGIESMAPMFYNRQIDLPYADINARRKVGELEEQLLQFPLGQVTDVMMSLWFAELGCRDLFRRAQMPLFDPNFKLPRRLRGRRRVVDFASKSMRSPTQEEVEGLPSTYGSSLYPVQRPRFVNMPGEV